jgi:acyl-coenzyme A thioesterase PaaI-like protein
MRAIVREQDQANVMQDTIAADALKATRSRHHPDCFVCCEKRSFGLQVRYQPCANNEVEATVSCPAAWEGYPRWVHGGITASLLDGAMTNCLFRQGVVAVTGTLRVHYRRPLLIGESARIAAGIVRKSPPLFALKAAVIQRGQVCATATGKFFRKAESPARAQCQGCREAPGGEERSEWSPRA